jgi:hypothetical protein
MRKPAAILLVLSLAVLALALVPAAGIAAKGGIAGKPGGGGNGGGGKPGGGGSAGGGTIDLVLVNSTDGVAHFGQQVTFAVSTSATVYPWVTVSCTKDGATVLQASRGIFPTSLGQNVTLGPTPSWSGGEADCTASLEDWDSYPRTSQLASMSFHVYP